MLPYWLLFLWPASIALRPAPLRDQHSVIKERWPANWNRIFWGLLLMLGFRHQVGGDWNNYEKHIIRASKLSLTESISEKDGLAYGFLNWVGAQWGGTYLVNLVCALFFVWGLVVFCQRQPRPWLALTAAVPYLITVVGMGYTRQGAAMGWEMLGLVALLDGRIGRYLVFIALAAAFHKSAVIMAPVAALASSKNRVLTLLLVGIVAFALYRLMLESSVEHLMQSYVGAAYSSSGAAIRVAMNALPALIFLIYRRHFDLSRSQTSFWTWMSLAGLGFVVLLVVSPSSTAVDRVALYWIPLQLFVWSRVPDVWCRSGGSKSWWTLMVVLYSALVHFVWLNFAQYSSAWLPYQFYPWVAFWK